MTGTLTAMVLSAAMAANPNTTQLDSTATAIHSRVYTIAQAVIGHNPSNSNKGTYSRYTNNIYGITTYFYDRNQNGIVDDSDCVNIIDSKKLTDSTTQYRHIDFIGLSPSKLWRVNNSVVNNAIYERAIRSWKPSDTVDPFDLAYFESNIENPTKEINSVLTRAERAFNITQKANEQRRKFLEKKYK